MKPVLVVVGSLNMDFVVRVDHLPAPGETVLGQDFQMIPGGKGANQACAAGRISGPSVTVRMVGRVGHDLFADHLRASLSAGGVDVSSVCSSKSQPTGVALIWVDSSGQNSIVVAPGANHELLPTDVEAMREPFSGAQFVLFQLETKLTTVHKALHLARESGARTMLDPAPAQSLTKEFLSEVDILTPNESEACLLLGRPITRIGPAEAAELASKLQELGPKTIVLKLGDQGCYCLDDSVRLHVPAFPAEVRDSTAAGDIFNAGLAVALAERRPMEEALRFANGAAAISVTRFGAQLSVPSRAETDEFLRKH